MPDGFRSLNEILNNDEGFQSLREVIKASDVVTDFKFIFPDLIKVADAVKVDKGKLILRVQNSIWRSELRFREKSIVEKINEFYKEPRVRGIKFIL
ncbi:MAG TPA: DUF721 domain-containing protein [Ignavibacteriaceae bacterium]|nr:DUF721 domain-containing protein [Ignavibacteriaceae bacterium]